MPLRLAGTIVLTVLVLLIPVHARPVQAQLSFPSDLAEQVAICMNDVMGDAMTRSTWVEPSPTVGWRVVLPLRGQPAAQRQGVQSPPPASNTLAWIDLQRYSTPRQVPDDIDNMSSYIMVTSTGETYAVYLGGYYWLRIRSASQQCFEATVDSRIWPI